MASNPKSRIPLELYPLVINHIKNTSDLVSMLVSSKVIFADVERKLYNIIQFGQGEVRRHILFLESVLDSRRTHLPGLVYHYYCSADSRSTALVSLITQALITFTNLKQLLFRYPSEDIFAPVLSLKNPPFQLELFEWIGTGNRIIRHHDNIGVLRFLATQHTLKGLHLLNLRPEFPQIPPLQNLQTLTNIVGSIPNILSFLPRPVPIKRILWRPDFLDNIDYFPPLPDLRVLFFTSDVGRPPLSVIADRFGALEVLGLIRLEPGELPHLYRLPLYTLVLDQVQDRDVIKFTEVFRKMRFLRHIFVTFGNGMDGKYLRWDRSAQRAILVEGLAVGTNWWSRLF